MTNCFKCDYTFKRKDIFYEIEKNKLIIRGRKRPVMSKPINYKIFCETCYKEITYYNVKAQIYSEEYTSKDLRTSIIFFLGLILSSLFSYIIFEDWIISGFLLAVSMLVLLDIRSIKKALNKYAT